MIVQCSKCAQSNRLPAARFGIQSIPTMIVFRNGSEADRLSGAMPASAIESRLSL